ncbi:MAG TPA: hypothetical protein VM869_10260 [Enhygromyxa sp.]|nr:hypothetical protein [Enhygromyxa sp.]
MSAQPRPTTFTLAAGLIALPLSLTACEAAEDLDQVDASTDASAEPDDSFRAEVWDPKEINPALCQEGEPSRPPVNGQCEIELYLNKVTMVTGQGASESRAELSAVVTAVAPNGSQTVVIVPEKKYNAGEDKSHRASLGTYTVQTGNQKNIQVCATFTEDDDGGVNGQDDVGSDCTNVQLSCDPVDGQPTFHPIVGPAALCGPNQCNGSASATLEVMRADADYDNVPNADDFTPEPCDELEKATNGIALVLYFHYDDTAYNRLAQSLGVDLSKNYGAYDYVALVMENAESNFWNIDGAAFRDADVVFEPSRDGLLEAMRHVTAKGYRFDVKTHARGFENGTADSEFTVITGDRISGQWLVDATEPDLVGTARGGIPIVAQWGTAAFQDRQMDAWHTIGALTASGTVHINFYPNEWGNYWDNWVGGMTYEDAVDFSRTLGVIAAADFEMASQGGGPPWLCIYPSAIGQNACAEDFFNDDVGPNPAGYNLEDIYDHTISGAKNMKAASQRNFIGNFTTTFGGGAAVWP